MSNQIKTPSIQINKAEWKTIGVKVRLLELPNLNRQLDRLGYTTLGDLVKDLIAGKITRLTDDQQIDIEDFLNYLKGKYHEHTAKKCYLSYCELYAHVFFGLNPDIELFKLKPHKRSWILQSIKKFGEYYFRKYNNRDVIQLIKNIIERYELNKNLDVKDRIYLVRSQFYLRKKTKDF